MKLPAKLAPLLFAFILSGMASLLVSGISTWRAAGQVDGFLGLWMSSWLPSWCVAFPVIFGLAPVVRRLVGKITKDS
ncbi:MAG: DUF2798 domain-containing protein [Rhizobiaceae bacterium]